LRPMNSGTSFTASLLLLAAVAYAAKPKPTSIVMDVDGVSDDVQAISLALQNPKIKVVAISTVSGSTNSAQAAANVARALRANNASVPIYKGAANPLAGAIDYTFSEQFFGKDGLGDTPNEWPKVLPSDFSAYDPKRPAAVALVELFRKKKNLTLVATGPLTNIATALSLDAEFAEWPQRLVLMGGNVYGIGNLDVTSTAESNFGTDPEAAYIVLKKLKCPITVVTWEAALFARERHDIDFYAHLDIDAPLAKFLKMAIRAPRAYKAKANSEHQFTFDDEITIGAIIDEEAVVVETQVRRAAVETRGQYTRGQIAVDWSQRSSGVAYDNSTYGDYRPITFVVNYNASAVNQLIVDAIHHAQQQH
jgi:purine nucleosidase